MSAKSGEGLRAFGNQPTGPACTRWLVAWFSPRRGLVAQVLFLAQASSRALPEPVWKGPLSAVVAGGAAARCILLLILHARARDSYAPVLPITYRGARITLCIAFCSAGSKRTEPISLGRAAHWPCLNPQMGHAHATLHVFLPLLYFDCGVAWHCRCVYTPLDCEHGPNL